MKFFVLCMKNCMFGWGITAVVTAVFSLISPDRISFHLLRVVLAEVTVVCVWSCFLFSIRSWEAGIWPRRIIVSLTNAAVGAAFVTLSGIRPFSVVFCTVFILGCFAVSAIAYLTADEIDRRRIISINEKLSGNE